MRFVYSGYRIPGPFQQDEPGRNGKKYDYKGCTGGKHFTGPGTGFFQGRNRLDRDLFGTGGS